MAIKPKNLPKHELIGRQVEVVKSSDPSKIGIKGRIVDESKNMFTILCNGVEKKVSKKECTFLFEREGVEIKGEVLTGRPEDRTKKRQ